MKTRPLGACYHAVVGFLAEMKGSGSGIAEVTGHTKNAVYGVILRLRQADSPLLQNLIDGNEERREAAAKKREACPPVEKNVVAAALQSRTPLEQAWHA